MRASRPASPWPSSASTRSYRLLGNPSTLDFFGERDGADDESANGEGKSKVAVFVLHVLYCSVVAPESASGRCDEVKNIRFRAERRLGELIKAQKELPREEGGGLARPAGPGRGKLGTKSEPSLIPNLFTSSVF